MFQQMRVCCHKAASVVFSQYTLIH